MGRFDGKVVIVTGSSSGIGQAALLGFAKEGASVVLHGVNPERLRATEQLLRDAGVPGDKVLVLPGQIELDATQDRLIQETIAKFGRIDVLVNNAGLGNKSECDESSTENLDYVLSVNLRAPFRLVELALPHLTKTKGNIINVSSVAAFMRPVNAPMMTAYGMSKSALDTFTKYECQRLAAVGVRMNNINPGPVATNITARNNPNLPNIKGLEEKIFNIVTPIGRAAQPAELVDAFLLLADEKSAYITGACWVLDGGMSVFAPSFDNLKL